VSGRRFVRIIPDPDPRADAGSRIRVDYDPDDTGAFCIADENVLPEKLLDPNCHRVQTVSNIELGRDTARSMRDALIDLCKHLDDEEHAKEVKLRVKECPHGAMPRSAGAGHWRDWHRGHGCHLDPDAPKKDAP